MATLVSVSTQPALLPNSSTRTAPACRSLRLSAHRVKSGKKFASGVQCAQEGHKETSTPAPPMNPSRRELNLSLLAAVAAVSTAQSLPANALLPGYSVYSRGNRTRFETSISSAVRPYSLEVPDSWSQDVVSLNDGKLYGVDLRYGSKSDGQLAVSVLPFANRESITEAGDPDQALSTFIELVGAFWSDNGFGDTSRLLDVVNTTVEKSENGVYYKYELKSPRSLIVANATDGQLYVLNVSANSRQWKSSESALRAIADSFIVPPLSNI
mmetsp:Transcript_37407/g.51925  ORF Transcript_37407/g.51925 Transcript_37407/m.51925 type:complete len:269 (-) Transcript_37407:159-965(-)|eukprot:CAMPEP_0196580082 /NCGR_PEP_ID=MMETSP1081-20130531/26883_1 /TAXON_ID=36882 /ORGANISM="Pyramimonas amylifera, Strain CCMP720" /LENGTH=268 /DNA_ID=CAMNT_0041899863 /DNA_START=113 /DNA_END=919 /DNA_ORIENTATION=-